MPSCQVSVIIPTYREAENIPIVSRRIHETLVAAALTHEIIISDDDSPDGTAALCETLSTELPLRLLHRKSNRGLSPAVIDAIAIAEGETLIVMDADLSHPAEKIPDIVALLRSHEADFVVGSRYTHGGSLDDRWPLWRRLNSLIATLPARGLTPLADPMSGFFGLRRADMPPPETLSPIGYKIGLELCVKGGFPRDKIREIPITFSDRLHGESKMNLREQLNYLRHLRRLYHHRHPSALALIQFIIVGSGGLLIDILTYLLLLTLNTPHLWARAIAYWPAVTFNWFFNRTITFKERPRRPPWSQWAKFSLAGILSFLINWGIYAGLTLHTPFFADHRLLALLIGVIIGTISNFLLSHHLIFRR